MICESTYGDREHSDLDGQFELAQWLNPVCERQDVVVIPAFAVGRAQTLLLYIARLKHQRRLPDVPVFLDSPMAIDASGLYHRFRDDHRLNDEQCRQMCQAATLVRTPDESKRLDRQSGPMIIISASGMATGRCSPPEGIRWPRTQSGVASWIPSSRDARRRARTRRPHTADSRAGVSGARRGRLTAGVLRSCRCRRAARLDATVEPATPPCLRDPWGILCERGTSFQDRT